MTRAIIDRVARMQPGEVRFRVVSSLRKGIGRLRSGISRPRWSRTDLARALAPASAQADLNGVVAALRKGDVHEAHVALAMHFSTRRSAFVVNACDRSDLAHAISRRFPGATEDAVRRGERLLQGRYDLLGYENVAAGVLPDWHTDPVHGRRCPPAFWSAIRYLDPSLGDHKITWELNRHQHWLALGRAGALSGDRKYYRAFTAQLASWMRQNPPLLGTNWASMLELAFRSISWLWALELFAGDAKADDDEPWLVDLLLGLDRQLVHVEQNLSHYFSPNTHLTGEALALYTAGAALPELKSSARRTAIGRDILLRESARQIRRDGGHAELSGHYHRYSTDFYLFATLIARRSGDDAAATVLEEAARRQARFLRAICNDRGERPLIGDDDGGQLFGMCGRPASDCRDTLAIAATVLREPALALGGATEEAYWVCGVDADRADASARESWRSIALADSGYYVSRTAAGDHLIFDAGPHGYLNGGHAHSDALSCVLSVAGRPFLVDPGTATYTMDADLRARFRSTEMHNTVVLDGRMQSEVRGPFHWHTTTNARARFWRAAAGCDYVEGAHDAYAPRRHTRSIIAMHGIGWWVLDHLDGEGHAAVDVWWHLHPSWQCSLAGPHVCRVEDESVLALASTAALSPLDPGSHPLAFWSPVYGRIEPAPVIRGTAATELPTSVATFIPATAEIARGLTIETVAIVVPPPAEWRACAFQVRWAEGAMTVVAALERSHAPAPDASAPDVLWGTGELRTDGRVAVIVAREERPLEVAMVNGSTIEAGSIGAILSLSSPAGIVRQPVDAASNLHAVGACEAASPAPSRVRLAVGDATRASGAGTR